jgi:hypothetical protein
MAMPEQHQLPYTTMQLAGHSVTAVTERLTPAGLGVLILICAGLAASTYFLNILIKGQQSHLANLLMVQERQMTQVLVTHNREFDELMRMVSVLTKDKPIPPPPLAEPLVKDDEEPVPPRRSKS